jgi:hypothetical protein
VALPGPRTSCQRFEHPIFHGLIRVGFDVLVWELADESVTAFALPRSGRDSQEPMRPQCNEAFLSEQGKMFERRGNENSQSYTIRM